MHSQSQIDLSKYRLEKASEMIGEADVLFQNKFFKGSNNRAYYAILHSMRAVLALANFDSKKHSGVIAEFQRAFVKTGIFEKEYSKIIMTASEIRNASDYDDYFIASKDESELQIINAKKFHDRVYKYLKDKLGEAFG